MRLKRDIRGFLGYGGTAGAWGTFLFLLLGIPLVRSPLPWNSLLVIITALFAIMPLFWLSGRITIEDEFIVAGSRFCPQKTALVDIRDAAIGKVPWGRGLVPGIILLMKSGETRDLHLSGALGEERRRVWISEIRNAVKQAQSVE